ELKVWQGTSDRRVFVGRGFDSNVATYYHDGNGRNRPGTLELTAAAKEQLGERAGELKAFLADLCAKWKSIVVTIGADGRAADDDTVSGARTGRTATGVGRLPAAVAGHGGRVARVVHDPAAGGQLQRPRSRVRDARLVAR